MKRSIFIILMLLAISNCFAQSTHEVIIITQIFHKGSSSFNTLIGTNKKEIEMIKKEKGYIFSNSSYVINNESFQVIKKYTAANCRPSTEHDPTSSDCFVIQFINGDNKVMCGLPNNKIAKLFFDGLLSTINKSHREKDCSELINELTRIKKYTTDNTLK